MEKKNIIGLIRYYFEKNESAFRNECISIANYFDSTGDYQLAEYIIALLSDSHTFSPHQKEGNDGE